MLLRNIKTGIDYEVPSAVYNAMTRDTKGLFQVIKSEDFVPVPDQLVESNISEESKIKTKKKQKNKNHE
jgi:hypothetical protein